VTARFERLCRDIFFLAQLAHSDHADQGFRWERRVASHIAAEGLAIETQPGGCSFLGRASLSGLAHQVDAVIGCRDVIVIGEWKAYRGTIPKNELLRFKAVSDDYYLSLGPHSPGRPIMRVFGGTGVFTPELRRYGALWGITLVDANWWPAPVLASARTVWPGRCDPHLVDRRQLRWLSRPLQGTLCRQPDGSYRTPPPRARAHIDALIALHAYWSDELWAYVDDVPGRFEKLVAYTCLRPAA
jgi:hypothetical protein